ncbi:glycosyltransferase family 2 protein [Geobacter sp. AOG1]|uniref:glycosyltransferase family 2 protein n=1 Tax=Geobacter sp. AOG1 TaxID=1566346 RepID=UPI001CC46038|nr:glycosyltransferase family 2 protein [Geobacter sp. AOG1]GFE58490.1 hypothetical protein AOG1_23700 [Geobacter sp. AOG1]
MPPKVTVCMPVYNAEAFVAEAISSILSQTYSDFELLIIDDGSTDGSAAIVKAFSDRRIRVIRSNSNLGIVAALNRGIGEAKGKYIARMDADDICMPDRLERQVYFMDTNPSVGICGTWLESFGSKPKAVWSPPCDDDEIKCSLLFESVLYHPTIMFRKSLFDDLAICYSADFPHAEDYELWGRLVDTCSFANIGKVLLKYRLHDQNIGFCEAATQQASADKVRMRLLNKLGIEPVDDELALHSALSMWRVSADLQTLQNAHDWLSKLVLANVASGLFPQKAFERIIARRWYQTCLLSTTLGFDAYRFCFQSRLCNTLQIPLHHRFIFLIRALLRKV